MKTSARFLAMLLAVVMIASAALSVSAFSDVTAGVEHATAISVLNQLGVIGGYEDGTFKPDQPVTRAEMAKLVYVLYTTFVDAGAGTVKFNDVAKDNWAVGYISWCASKGIIGGYGDGNFGPANNVTYDQALKMVCGALGYTEWDSALWPVDVRSKALRELALGKDIPASVKGEDNLTRGQVAQIMYNALLAPMNEMKTVMVPVNANYSIPVQEPKVLATDIWNYVEETYEIVAVKLDATDDSIKIQKVVNGALTGSAETVELADLGLEAFTGKTADLIGLYITTITKDEEMLASATIRGSVLDNVAVTAAKDDKSLTINGVKYTAKDFAADAEHKIAFTGEATVFGADEKLTDAFKAIIAMEQLTRIVDKDGDGNVDTFTMVPKTAYKVIDVKTENKVPTVSYKKLDGTGTTLKTPVANVSIELAKDDIFVGAKMSDTLYAEIVKPVTTYATKLSTTAGKITLNDGGEVLYKDLTVAGVTEKNLTTAVLGEDNEQIYYIYNGQVIYTDATGTVNAYDIVILKDVIETEGEFNNVTMEEGVAYKAVLIVDGVEKEVVLADAKAAEVAGADKTAKQLFDLYKAGKDAVTNKRLYNYTLVAGYEETDDGYVLTIEKDLDASENGYKMIPANSYLKYNATTGLYSIADVAKVTLDENSIIYYTYAVETGAAKGFIDLGSYTSASITDKSFGQENDVVTSDVTYLAYDEDAKMWTLIATMVSGKIEGATDETTVSYANDGRLVLYAPEASSIELVEGKNYNSYIFMDNATLTTKEAALDKTVEHDDANDTEAGKLYGWNPTAQVYDEITAADTLNTVKGAVLTDVLASKDLIGYSVAGAAEELIKVDSSVTIWGLADEELDSYKALTLAELADMFTLVADYNATLEEGAEALEIRIIMTSYKDANDDYVLSGIIVELFEADEETEVVSAVNSTILNNYFVERV